LNSPEIVDNVYANLKGGEWCEKERIKTFNVAVHLFELNEQLRDSLTIKLDEITELSYQIKKSNEEHTKASVDLQKAKDKKIKPFGIGVQLGTSIDGKVYLGAGISYDIIRF
jgi:hypothetical protein